MTTTLKLACAVALIATWGGFALMGLTPVQDFINTIRDALIALGVFQATMTNPKE